MGYFCTKIHSNEIAMCQENLKLLLWEFWWAFRNLTSSYMGKLCTQETVCIVLNITTEIYIHEIHIKM
jgi:hypothetical protein